MKRRMRWAVALNDGTIVTILPALGTRPEPTAVGSRIVRVAVLEPKAQAEGGWVARVDEVDEGPCPSWPCPCGDNEYDDVDNVALTA